VEVQSETTEDSRDFSSISYNILASIFLYYNPHLREIYSSGSWSR